MKIRPFGSLGLRKPVVCILLSLFAALPAMASAADKASSGRDALFEDDSPADTKSDAKPDVKKDAGAPSALKGYLQFELAGTTADPEHMSKARTRADLSAQGTLRDGVKWKLGARLDYDAVYDLTHFYPNEVENNQRWNFMLRENYVDFGAGGLDFRLGRQHVVWGEMVGLFFADVVSARDMREFILPEFDAMRIPQWAARAEYFKDDFHAELLWIPVASYDLIGKPGAEFYPFQPIPPGAKAIYRSEQIPDHNGNHMNYGVRLSTLTQGWDLSGFYYSSMDVTPTFRREFVAPDTFVFEAQHGRINQLGGTVSKDFGSVVLKSEAVYTEGRKFTVLRLTEADGLVPQNTLDWALGLDFTLPADTRFNVQLFQRAFFNHDPDLIQDKRENGYSLYLSKNLGDKWEGQLLFISSFNRSDWLFRPKLIWNFEKNWRLQFGADVFKGPPLGLFGQYDAKDRIYSEVRYSF